MRNTTFDLVAMSLMALGVIFICGVLLMIGLSKANSVRKSTSVASRVSLSGTRGEADDAEGPGRVATPDQRDEAEPAADGPVRAHAGQR